MNKYLTRLLRLIKSETNYSVILNHYWKNSPILINFNSKERGTVPNLKTGVLTINCANNDDGHSLIHEMSHFVEIDEDRIFLKNLGLIASGQRKDFTKLGPTLREMRVFAYQINVFEKLQIKFSGLEDLKDYGSVALDILGDSAFAPGESDKEKKTWLIAKFEEYLKTCTAEDFEARWNHRMELLWKIKFDSLLRAKPLDNLER